MSAPRQHVPHTVEVRQRWSGTWTEVPGLFCDWFRFAAAPDVQEAQFSYNFGKVLRRDAANWAFFDPLTLEEYFVRVTLNDPATVQDRVFIGIIVSSTQQRLGMHSPDYQPTGRQILYARGLEYLLQRGIVDHSWVRHGSEPDKKIHRAIGFNLGAGLETARFRQANMSADAGDEGVNIFAERLNKDLEEERDGTAALAWHADQIVTYLLKYFIPRDKDDQAQIEIELEPGASTDALLLLQPTLHAHGKTVKQCLDEVIDRRRLMTWWVSANTDDALFLNVRTFNKSQIDLPSGEIIAANTDQQTLLLEDQSYYADLRLMTDGATRFDAVIARGERLGACFSIDEGSDSLEADWHGSLTSEYNTGATGAADYGTLDSWQKQDANADHRASDTFLKVFRYFRIPPAFDWEHPAGLVCPDPNDEEESAAYWYPGMRLLPYLPLLTEHDYEPDPDAVTADSLEGSKPEYLRPFAMIKEEGGDRWYWLNRMGNGGTANSLTEAGGRDWSANLRMQDDGLGIIIDVQGYPQHAIAHTEFSPLENTTNEPPPPADMKWQNSLCTVFCEFDQYAEKQWPEEITTEADYIKRLIIEAPNHRLDYLTPNTVVGIDDNGELIRAAGGYVRDDRPLLESIARTSYEWYGQVRKAMEVTILQLSTNLDIGTLITSIGPAESEEREEINTVVTSMMFDLIAGTIQVKTQFAELDVRA